MTANSKFQHYMSTPVDPAKVDLPPENNDRFQDKAKILVAENFNTTFVKPYPSHDHLVAAEADNFYVVWFVKVLGNWKALLSTDLIDGQYWEVTYNGEKEETYVDHYKKSGNACFSDEWFRNATLP